MSISKIVPFVALDANLTNDEKKQVESVVSSLSLILSSPADISFWRPSNRNEKLPESGTLMLFGTYRGSLEKGRQMIPFLNKDGEKASEGIVSINTVIKHLGEGKVIADA